MSEDQFGLMDDVSFFGGRKKDTCKRKSRNMSEKRRRDQFNNLINEMCTMVSKNKKMDKTTVLKTAIAVIKSQKEQADEMRSHEIKEVWKPSFMSNDEFEHLMLESVNAFLILFDKNGKIIHVSESVTPLLGHCPENLIGSSLFDLISTVDRASVVNKITKHKASCTVFTAETPKEDYYITFDCNLECESLESSESPVYELVHFKGIISFLKTESSEDCNEEIQELCFCCVVKLCNLQLIREQSATEKEKREFTARHSLEWKFLFLDHRGPPIIGYLPLEVLGTSGYDYIHPDDLQELTKSHEALMQSGEGQSCYYRFLTKGQQWIWLCTHYYITYHQWNSKPEFVVCTNRVITYAEVQKYKQQEWKQSLPVKVHEKKITDDQRASDETEQVTTSSQERSDADTGTDEVKRESQASQEKSVPTAVTSQAPQLPADINTSCSTSQRLLTVQQSNTFQTRLPSALPQKQTSAVLIPNTIEALNRMIFSSNPLVMTTLQQQLHLKLLEKQRELQESILKQQQELIKIHNQLSLTTELGSSLMLVQPNPGQEPQHDTTAQNLTKLMSLGSLSTAGSDTVQVHSGGPAEGAPHQGFIGQNLPTMPCVPSQLDPRIKGKSSTSSPTYKLLHLLAQQQHQQQQVSSVGPVHPDHSIAFEQQQSGTGGTSHTLQQQPDGLYPFPTAHMSGQPQHNSPLHQSNRIASHNSSNNITIHSLVPGQPHAIQHQLYMSPSPQTSIHLQYLSSHSPIQQSQQPSAHHPHHHGQQIPPVQSSLVSAQVNPLQFDITRLSASPTQHQHSSTIQLSENSQHQQPAQSLHLLSAKTTSPVYTVSQVGKSPLASTSPSPAMIPQPSPSPIDLMLSHDPMINSGSQAFEPISFSVNAHQEQNDYKIFDSIG